MGLQKRQNYSTHGIFYIAQNKENHRFSNLKKQVFQNKENHRFSTLNKQVFQITKILLTAPI
jgi:hypothetical protein